MRVSRKVIDEMAQRMVREVDPQRTLLFGSWVRGDARADSDVDLLVVEREPFGEQRGRRPEAARIWRCLSDFRMPTDILVYSVGEIEQWRGCRHHVIGKALMEGKVLYQSD